MIRKSIAISIASALCGAAVILLTPGAPPISAAQNGPPSGVPGGPPGPPIVPPGPPPGLPPGPPVGPPPTFAAMTCLLPGLPDPPNCCWVGGNPTHELDVRKFNNNSEVPAALVGTRRRQ